MWIVAFITVVAVLIFASRMKELKDAREAIAAAGGISSKYQCMDFSKGPKIAYIVLAILGIISGIYGYTIQDYTTVALGILIFFLFLAEFFMANIQYKFYYSSTKLVHCFNKFIPDKEAHRQQQAKMKNSPFKWTEKWSRKK